jgi:hypothetical protein
MGVLTRGALALGTRLDDLDGVASRERRGRLGNLNADEFTGQTMAHEDDSPIGESSHATPSGGPLDAHCFAYVVAGINLHHFSLLKRLISENRDQSAI